jgi:hypothetical protein
MSAMDNVIKRQEQYDGRTAGGRDAKAARAELAALRAELAAYRELCVRLNAVDASDLGGAISSLRAENLQLGAGNYLLDEIGKALNCAPDATILQRIAELESANAALESAVSEGREFAEFVVDQLRYDKDHYLFMAADAFLAAHPAPQTEQEQPV